jgi:predicted PurR-regulated permease PerM
LQLVLVIFFVFFIFRDAHLYADALHTGSRALAGDLGERMLALAKGRSPGSWSASSGRRPHRRWWR